MKYSKTISLIAFIIQSVILTAQPSIFLQPIEGVYGEDFIVVNYVDWSIDSIMDHHCGTKTYDGHQGTDFLISGFPQMDMGVNVQAVDSGVVVFIHDGEPDRNTDGNPELGFGNYVAIKHPDLHFSYYAHLKKNSIIVAVGNAVVPGENIAEVGSSGNSTDPHLHFELWYDSLYLADPFKGNCGNNYNYWIDSIPYDTTFNVWESGLTNYVPPIDSLRERPKARIKFSSQDSIITFWNLQYGLKQGDSTRIEWLTPSGNYWFDYKNIYQKDWWFYYYYSYIPTPPDTELGEWTYNYYYNDSLVLTGHFILGLPVSLPETETISTPVCRRIENHTIEVVLPKNMETDYIEIYTLSGQKLLHKTLRQKNQIVLNLAQQKTGLQIYLIVVRHSQGVWSQKIIL